MIDRPLDEMMTSLEGVINRQLPLAKKNLAELLQMDHPQVVCRDGSTYSFKRKELETLSSLLQPEDWSRLALPIILVCNPEYGVGTVVISGELEILVVSKLLRIQSKEMEQNVVLYRPQLEELRRKLRTTTQIAFLPTHTPDELTETD
ncbi:MAG: DUF61 family protein [archaeon]